MLVYGVTLWLSPQTTALDILKPVAGWLSRRTREPVSATDIQDDRERTFRDGSRLGVLTTHEGTPHLTALRFQHGDRDVSGRQWVLDVGIRAGVPRSETECTIFLSTSEISSRVTTPIRPTRPMVVSAICEDCVVSNRTCGLTVANLDDATAADFRYVLEDPDRLHPVVLVSPHPNDGYLIDVARTQSLLIGLADVIRITPEATPYKVLRTTGELLTPWDGAVSIVFPSAARHGRAASLPRKLMPDELAAIRSSGLDAESEVFSIITHRTNLPHYRRQVSVDTVREERLRRELNARRAVAVAGGEAAEMVSVLEAFNGELVRKNEELRTERDQAQFAQAEAEEASRRAEYTASSLRSALAGAGLGGGRTEDGGPATESLRQAVGALAEGEPTLEQSLTIVAELFRDRVVVLKSAWDSAEAAMRFKYGKRGFDLLWTLATEYWEALCRGEADASARQCFGKAYAAKESESVMNNRKACELRTFMYRGAPIEMFRHLKVGVKDSAAETLRIHFEWLADDEAIVIGHCGEHLDHG